MRTGSIYIIKNLINDKVYIGQTTMTVHERFMTHMKPSTTKKRSNYKLYMAVSKYGADNFYVETLETNIPVDELDEREIRYIAEYNSYYKGYNSTKGGDGRIINLIDNEEELLYKARNGVSAYTLADDYDVNVATIYRTLHKLGFYYYEVDEAGIIEDAKNGMRQVDIAQKYQINKVTVQRILRKNDIRFHKQRIDKRQDFDISAIEVDYKNQMTITEICKKHNITKTSFYRLKEQFNFQTRPQLYSNVTQRTDVSSIINDYHNGMKIKQICEKYNISSGSLYRIVKEIK